MCHSEQITTTTIFILTEKKRHQVQLKNVTLRR